MLGAFLLLLCRADRSAEHPPTSSLAKEQGLHPGAAAAACTQHSPPPCAPAPKCRPGPAPPRSPPARQHAPAAGSGVHSHLQGRPSQPRQRASTGTPPASPPSPAPAAAPPALPSNTRSHKTQQRRLTSVRLRAASSSFCPAAARRASASASSLAARCSDVSFSPAGPRGAGQAQRSKLKLNLASQSAPCREGVLEVGPGPVVSSLCPKKDSLGAARRTPRPTFQRLRLSLHRRLLLQGALRRRRRSLHLAFHALRLQGFGRIAAAWHEAGGTSGTQLTHPTTHHHPCSSPSRASSVRSAPRRRPPRTRPWPEPPAPWRGRASAGRRGQGPGGARRGEVRRHGVTDRQSWQLPGSGHPLAGASGPL